MPRTPRLVLPLFVLLLLAACAAPPRPAGEGRGEGGEGNPASLPSPTVLPPTATPQPTATSTPTVTPTPTATPLPAPVAPVLRQLEGGWGLAAEQVQYAPASEAETAHLAELAGVRAEDLGAVFKVKTAEGSLFWATEREGAFAVRQVPAYERYENGQPVAVPAHEEAVAVKRMLDDPTEFGHWNGGKVVEVQTAEGTGWYYPGEKGEWEKIYESGFDYEFLGRLAAHFKEVTGVDYRDWAEGKMGHNTSPAQLDIEQVHRRNKAQWVDPRYIGFFLGAGWIHGSEGDFLTVVEAFPMWNRETKHNETALVPVVVGIEKEGRWNDLIGEELNADGSLSYVEFVGDKGIIPPTKAKMEGIFENSANLGKEVAVMIVTYLDRDGTLKLDGKGVDDETAAKFDGNSRLNNAQLDLIKKHWPDWASWFGSLPKDEQETLMRAIRKHGMLAVAVYEDDPALEGESKRYPLPEKPAGFLVWSLDVSEIHPATGWGAWVLP